MKKNTIIIILIIVLFGLVGAGIFVISTLSDNKEDKLMLSYLTTEQLREDYDKAREAEEKIKDSDILLPYIQAGFNWKVLADTTKEEVFYKKTIEIYSSAIDKFGMRYYMPYVNLGGIYQELGEYPKAEEMLKKAIEILPGESSLYVRLAELYQYHMNKSPEEILAVYNRGITRVLSTLQLAIGKASYLRDTGYKQESLELFEKIYAETRGNAHKLEIDRLRAELGMVIIED